MWILFIMLLPIIVVSALQAGDIIGSKTAYAPAFYSTSIFLISIAIGLMRRTDYRLYRRRRRFHYYTGFDGSGS